MPIPQSRVQEIDGDLIVAIPYSVLKDLTLDEGDEVQVFVVSGAIMLKPVNF